MRQHDFFTLLSRLEHRQANFQRRGAPAPAVKYGPPLVHRVVQFFDFGFAAAAARG